MPATLVAYVVEAVASVVCQNCAGTLRVVDPDGTLCGVLGAAVPCSCTGVGRVGPCACSVPEWGANDGFTGWVPVPPAEWMTDDDPVFRPCSVHAPQLAVSVGVAA